ncbi:MAG: ABC transporter permease [Alphaproteobacteria bacterium]|nr:ABC transporter permease [Alphaproteobacteria bacterium]
MATLATLKGLGRELRHNRVALGGFAITSFVLVAIVIGPSFSPYDPTLMDFTAILQPPSWAHPFGTNSFGIDVLTRVLYGARNSFMISFAGVSLGAIVGTLIGMTSAYMGKLFDAVAMRLVDLLFAFPIFVLALMLMLILGFGVQNVIVAIALVYIPNFARMARNTTMVVKSEPYVQAAQVMGQPRLRIMVREILPNIAAPLFVQFTVGLAFAIIIEAGLSFIGLGVQPPTPSLGVMMADGKDYFHRGPWVLTLTGLALMFAILGLNLLGDGLRDLLDPRLRRRSAA